MAVEEIKGLLNGLVGAAGRVSGDELGNLLDKTNQRAEAVERTLMANDKKFVHIERLMQGFEKEE